MRKERKNIGIDRIRLNEGQLDWLPKNPRQWTQTDIDKTAASIVEDPDFLEDRPLLVVPFGKEFVAFGGNLRHEGCKAAKKATAPCVVYYPENEEDYATIKRRAKKDNGSFGLWDYDELANSWDDLPLADWGVPSWPAPENAIQKEMQEKGLSTEAKEGENDDKKSYTLTLEFKTKQQKSEWIERAEKEGVKVRRGLNWGRDEDSEHRSTLCPYVQTYKLRGFNYTTSFHNTIKGERLSIIKQNPDNVQIFALAAEELIKRNRVSNPCILLSAPPRKHKENNFAVAVCRRISQDLGITYNEEAIEVINKDRFRPLFKLNICLDGYSTVIIYDDIVTTGKTLLEMKRIIGERQTLVIAGLKNHHPMNLE